MANIRIIRRRIRSVQSVAKITKAMEMMAASRMRRAQLSVIAARPYSEKIYQVLADLAAQPQPEDGLHPLLERRPVQKIAVIHITTDRGLCGGLNANVNRRTGSFVLEQSVPVVLVTVGRKGRDFMARYGRELRAEFTRIGDRPTILDIAPIARVVMDDFTNAFVDQVFLAYSRFITTLTQRPVLEQLLPVEPSTFPRLQNVEYLYEPNSPTVLAALLPRFVEMQLYHAILESIASEQSARMVAMRSATDNANSLIQDLTLTYNKARQEMITKELLDIAGGAAALA
ncbi:MAG: ATP synthase F1 subunit gamma [Chloroflexi bacterium]|nr:ATP synthase F1 subunit gamma [Chloroflexota bacterium]